MVITCIIHTRSRKWIGGGEDLSLITTSIEDIMSRKCNPLRRGQFNVEYLFSNILGQENSTF